MATETDLTIVDVVHAELIDCTPPLEPPATVEPLPAVTDVTPTATIREATIAQTGADPPPR